MTLMPFKARTRHQTIDHDGSTCWQDLRHPGKGHVWRTHGRRAKHRRCRRTGVHWRSCGILRCVLRKPGVTGAIGMFLAELWSNIHGLERTRFSSSSPTPSTWKKEPETFICASVCTFAGRPRSSRGLS